MGKDFNDTINIFNTKDINIFYGIPNSYTSYSIGNLNPYESFNYGYHNNLDFLILTDQNNFLKNTLFYNGKSISKWNLSLSFSKRFSKKHENFLSIIGFEAKTVPYGEILIINSNSFFTGEVENINLLILWMINNPDSIILLKHPLKTTLNTPYNPLLNKLITSMAICYGSYGERYVRREKYYYKLLDKGWLLGAINSQNNSKGDFGNYDNVTGIICPKLNRVNLIKAFRDRRTFSSESKSLRLYFLCNDTFMGGVIPSPCEKLNFSIILEDFLYTIDKIEIISNGGNIVHSINNLKLNKIKYLYEHTLKEDEDWFLIKVYEEGERIAFSSPIFIR